MSQKKVALIGAGTIARKIAKELNSQLKTEYTLVGIMKRQTQDLEMLAEKFETEVTTDFDDILALKPDFIVEAASVKVVKEYGQQILAAGISFIPLSVGGLVDPVFYTTLQELAKVNNSVLYIPSGAIGGFDLMRKLTLADTPEVTINTYKSPESLKDADWTVDLTASPNETQIVFDGTAAEAIKYFPQNINIAIATALATVGPSHVRTTIHCDPNIQANLHELSVKNKEGTANISFAAKPSTNARTSSITAWSVISLLKNIAEPVRFF